MAKKYNNEKLNKSAIITLISIAAVIIAVILISIFTSNKGSTFASDYGLTGEHVFQEISFDDFQNKLDADESFYIYYGKVDNELCVTNVTVINEAAKAYDIDVIYYIDAEKISEGNRNTLRDLTLKPNSMPQVIKFKDGDLVETTNTYSVSEPTRDYDWYSSRLFSLE